MAINRFCACHVQLAFPLSSMTRKKTHDFGGNDDENGNFSDALFLHPNIIETEILSS